MDDENIKIVGMKTGEKIFCGVIIFFTLAGVILQVIPGMRFSGRLCLCLAIGCIGWIFLSRWAENDKKGKICKKIISGCLAAGLMLFAILEGVVIRSGHEDWSALPADAVIILGAGVNGETPSLTLQSRLDKAWEYIENHGDIVIILSGGQGEGENITEAEAMRRVLVSRGADESRLLMEENSNSTKENFAFSRDILIQNGFDINTARIAFVTNDFHVFRAKVIAQKLKINNIIGIPAKIPWPWLSVNYYIREAFALVKAIIFD